MTTPTLTLHDVQAAAQQLAGQVLATPCLESRTLGQILDARVFLKFENLQFTASFKERGALNKLARLMASGEPVRGVIAASAGNHAQGLAHHAQRLGLRAVIVMPELTPAVKVERTRGFGAEVLLHGQTFDEAHERALPPAARGRSEQMSVGRQRVDSSPSGQIGPVVRGPRARGSSTAVSCPTHC